MSCIFIKDNKNQIVDVRTESGKPSKLFKAALDKFADRQKAIDIVAVSLSDDFQQTVDYRGEEPTLSSVLNYIADNNASTDNLSPQQDQDLKNSLLSVQVNSFEEFYDKLQQAFYDSNGIFNPTESKLRKSGLYTNYEISSILGNIELQQKIKTAVERLNNEDYQEQELEDYYNFSDVLEKTSEFNSFGKLNVLNPYIVEKTAVDLLTREQTQEYPYQQEFSTNGYVRAENMQQDLEGNITPEQYDNTRAQIILGVKSDLNPVLISDASAILNTPQNILDNNIDATQKVLSNIEAEAAKQGIDLTGLVADKPFLTNLLAFVSDPNTQNTENFIEDYNRVFQKSTGLKSTPIKKQDNKNYVLLNTNKAEDTLLTENNLVKAEDGLFIRVRRQPLENLYNIVLSYNSQFSSKDALKDYVQGRTTELYDVENPDNAEELVLLKMYFNLPVSVEQRIDKEQETINDTLFEGNQEYLQNEFIADFNIESINQKRKNSDQWKNFYSNFTINSQGITLLNDDPITLNTLNKWIEEIKPSIANNLKQYSLISKQLPILGETELDSEVITGKDNQRALVVNYPQTLQELNKENYKIDDNNIIIKNATDTFIRVGKDTFETVQTEGGISLYVKLPSNDGFYNQYNIKQPRTEIDLRDYKYLETTPDKWLTTKKKEEIIQENFNC